MSTVFTTTAALLAIAALMGAGGVRPAYAGDDVMDSGGVQTSETMKAITATSTLSFSPSVAIALAPAQVTLVATVAGTALKGDIAFKSGSVTLATAVINKNTATATVTLSAAIHALTAVYTASPANIVSPPVIVVVDNSGLACS